MTQKTLCRNIPGTWLFLEAFCPCMLPLGVVPSELEGLGAVVGSCKSQAEQEKVLSLALLEQGKPAGSEGHVSGPSWHVLGSAGHPTV